VNHKHSDFDCAQLERQTMSNGKQINVNVFDQSKSRLKSQDGLAMANLYRLFAAFTVWPVPMGTGHTVNAANKR